MRVGKEWRVINDGDPQVLIRELGLSAIAARVLVHRGVSDPDAARRFLSPSLSDLPDPSVMKDMDRAVARVSRALRSREKIHVFGDYDVDGTTATAVLCLFLRNAGAEVSFSVPDRTREGYGLNAEAVKRIAASGARLLITADCGIASRDEIRWAAGEGLDVVVTDHHEPPEELPPAVAVLNPKRNDCPYPFKGLAGVGVAFHLLIALRARLREEAFFPPGEVPNLREYLDLVALGTIADVVPLTGPNRILAKHGLAELGRSRRPGIAALKALCTLADAPLIDTEAVHFRLAPRINAAGRMRDAAQAVELFTTGDPARARRIASDLDELNSVRQRTEEAILNEAREMIESGGEGKKSIVLSSAKWHPGIVGIVASRLVEEYQCPAVLIALGDETGRGSGRSIAGFSLYEALKSCSRWMERFGGHDQAGGLVIRSENIPFFAAAFESAAAEMLGGGDGVPVLEIDALTRLEEMNASFLSELKSLAPFGAGNPEPVLAVDNLAVADSRPVGKGHLRLRVKQGRHFRDVIAFGMGARHPVSGEDMRMAFVPCAGTFNGQRTLRMKLIDLYPRGDDEKEKNRCQEKG